MKKMFSYSLAAFIFVSGCSTVDHARDAHEERALQELEQAVRSAEKGHAAGVIEHTEKTKKHLIEENREHPHTHPFISIYGQFPKAEHDIETFEEMDKAIGEAKKGNLQRAGEAAEGLRYTCDKELNRNEDWLGINFGRKLFVIGSARLRLFRTMPVANAHLEKTYLADQFGARNFEGNPL